MILRNLLLEIRLCNGTRLRILEIMNHLLRCEVTSEETLEGEKRKIFIPRITLVEEKTFGFKLHRKQFPVKLAFALSINKAQGQTLDFAGLDLRQDVFSHGQLYVGLSRVRSWDCIKVRVHDDNDDGTVKNEVWQELL